MIFALVYLAASRVSGKRHTVYMALTMGDASGVGPEIVLRRFAAGQLGDDVVIYGDAAILAAGARLLQLDVDIRTIGEPAEACAGRLNVVDEKLLVAADLTPGRRNPRAGAAALAYVERATKDALAGRVAGVVTLPLNKEATRATTPGFVGHTEFIANLCGTRDFAMMLVTRDISVAHVSGHVPLAEAIRRVTRERVAKVIALTQQALRELSPPGAQPRVAVCGLNPHAGEHGMFGAEDADIVARAIHDARGQGIDASGPYPADTVFHQAIRENRFDGIVCMYHDQGHAPMKLHAFESAVNVTTGLPILRTSVDHGTAFDIAWQGKAFTSALGAAVNCAWRLARGRGEAPAGTSPAKLGDKPG